MTVTHFQKMQEVRKDALENPKPGDLWHERLQVVLLVIGVFEDFIIISKAYNSEGERFLATDPDKFLVLTKEEFEKETSFSDPITASSRWVQLSSSVDLSSDPKIQNIVRIKKIGIELQKLPEVIHLNKVKYGDVWKLKDDKCITIIDKYLKDYLIISYDSNQSVMEILNNDKQFTNLRIISYEEFKLCVLKNKEVEDGFIAEVSPLLLRDAVSKFKQSN